MNDGTYYSIAQWESPYFGTIAITIILLNAKVGTFPLSYAVKPSLVSLLFYCIDPYFIFKLTIFTHNLLGFGTSLNKATNS